MGDLHALPPPQERTEVAATLVRVAAEMAMDPGDGSQLAGYALVALYSDGTSSSSVFKPSLPSLEEGLPRHIGEAMFFAWVETALRQSDSWIQGLSAVDECLSPPGE